MALVEEETYAMIQPMTQVEDNIADDDNNDNMKAEITDDMFCPEGAQREIGSMVWIYRVADINLARNQFFANFDIELYVLCIIPYYVHKLDGL